ncbi:Nucleoporin GLE2 [Astathelohania contejeani]|uniref:Nucleoporin GLE2 n=1 Tax=Astathelohania contejeani TaxID=164912 RepID=A0ABQ7I0G3_9MICR|nr:Nucleoporin GLE2 [Thelohania contejeani]
MSITNFKFSAVDIAPSDTPTEIAFSQSHGIMAVTSWDGTMRFYNSGQPPFTQKSQAKHEKPLLSCCFNQQGTIAVASGTDGKLLVHDLQSSQSFSFQAHQAGIRSVRVYGDHIVSASWDQTIKFWDLRSQTPVHTINTGDRVLTMDLQKDFMVFTMPGNKIQTYNMKNLGSPGTATTKLTWQIRSLSVMYDNESFIVGGIEGRAEVINPSQPANKFIFKCHRTPSDLYSVNTVSPNPANSNIIATGGSDGKISFYDRGQRIKVLHESAGGMVSCGRFSPDGQSYVFGTGYDWSRGYESNNENVNVKILQFIGI